MKYLKLAFNILFVFVFIFGGSYISFANNKDSKVDIQITQTSTSDKEKEKETIYTPQKATPIKLLPQTGEILTSFMLIIIGLSILVFILGILVSRLTIKDIRLEY